MMGGDFTRDKRVHPKDHVKVSQSSNDTLPGALHIAAIIEMVDNLISALERFR